MMICMMQGLEMGGLQKEVRDMIQGVLGQDGMKITKTSGERVAQGRTEERIGSQGGIVNLATARKMEKGGLAEEQVSMAEAKEDETVRGNMEHTMKTRSCMLLRQERSEEGREGKNRGMGFGKKDTPRVGEIKMLMI